MQLHRVRSGLTESTDEVIAVAIDENGTVLFNSGDVDRPLFYRSAVKSLQAIAAARTGLRLPAEHLAVTCSSHGGYPVHLAIVDRILTDHGLTTGDLRTTPGRPMSRDADVLQVMLGNTSDEPRFHNCSGKHAGWLAACTVAGYSTHDYLDPTHPLQIEIRDVVREFTDIDPEPTGVDGCGAPTLRGSVMGLARGFARLSSNPEAARVRNAIRTYPALVADNVRSDGRAGIAWDGPQKVGAEGCFAMSRPGLSIATKSVSGNADNAVAAALHVADRLGSLTREQAATLATVMEPPVLGGGRPVGRTVVGTS